MRELWQAKVILHTKNTFLGAIMLSIIAESYDDAMEVLMRVIFPGFTSIKRPFLCSIAKINWNGTIVADIQRSQFGKADKDQVIFKNEQDAQDAMRRLADELKLNDRDRVEMFKAFHKWLRADRRLDPTMNPRDPDAKRHAIN